MQKSICVSPKWGLKKLKYFFAMLLSFWSHVLLGDVTYSNRQVTIRDKIVVNGTDFRVDVKVSESTRPIFLKEIFRHRAIGYLAKTRVPDQGNATDNIELRLEELRDISRELKSRTPTSIAYQNAPIKVVTPIMGNKKDAPSHSIDPSLGFIEKIKVLDSAAKRGDFLSVLDQWYSLKNEKMSIDRYLNPSQKIEVDRKLNEASAFISSDGLIKFGSLNGFVLKDSIGGDHSQIIRKLFNYTAVLDACSGEKFFYKLLALYVFRRQAFPIIFLKTRTSSYRCESSLLKDAIENEREKITFASELQSKPQELQINPQAILLEALERVIQNPSNEVKELFLKEFDLDEV